MQVRRHLVGTESMSILVTGVLEKLVLFLLIVLSVWSVSIMIAAQKRFKTYKLLKSEDIEAFKVQILSGNSEITEDLKTRLLNSLAYEAWLVLLKNSTQKSQAKITQNEKLIKSWILAKREGLDQSLSVLATLGANAPFIGLFGTVLGIIRSFAALSENQSAASSVMSGISQALIATAAGLFVAIPAVIAFNYFQAQIKKHLIQVEQIKEAYLSQNI